MPVAANLPELFTPEDLVDAYDLSPDTVGDWLRSGQLVGFKLGRRWFVHPDDWARFLDRRRAQGDPS